MCQIDCDDYYRFATIKRSNTTKREKILKLRKKRDELWKRFCSCQKKNSFSAWNLSGELNEVQQKLDDLEEENRPSKRYDTEIDAF